MENTVGELLREVRRSKKLEIKDAARDLKIRIKYLEAIESGDISNIYTKIYFNGYLKSYARWLGLDSGEIINLVSKEVSPQKLQKKYVLAPSSASSLFLFSDSGVVRPGGKILLFSIVSSILIYSAWYFVSFPRRVMELDYLGVAALTGVNQSVQEASSEAKYIVYSDNPAVLKMISSSGKVEERLLKAGEVQFITVNSGMRLQADRSDSIEVFLDDEESTFLGKFKDVFN